MSRFWRLWCRIFGHESHELQVAGHAGGVYCPRCDSCALLPPPVKVAVTFADLVELAKKRDAFLAEDGTNFLTHLVSHGQHVVRLTFWAPASGPTYVVGRGEHFWSALREALRLLHKNPERAPQPRREDPS